MNAKKLIIGLAFGIAACQLALSQTSTADTNVAATVTDAGSVTNTAASDQVTQTESTTVVTTTSTVTNEPLTAPDATNETAATTPTPTNADVNIPLIQFSDVPITTAIENLARQAGINYLIDPRIGYGQPDQNGQIKPEPTISIRWENVTAAQALMALLDTYGLDLVQNRNTGIAVITLKNPNAPPPLITRVIQLKYASVSNMTEAVASVLTDKRSKVLADTRTSQLVVVATDPEQAAVDTLVNQLDKITRQVLIETKLVEISSNPQTEKGIDWSGTLAAQHISFGNSVAGYILPPTAPTATTVASSPPVTTVTPGFPGVPNGVIGTPGILANTMDGFGPEAFLNADGVSAVLSFLNSSKDAQVVSTPRVVTLDNQTATISETLGYPVINVTAGTANTTGGSTIEYTNVGTTLEVTPRISANDYIWLKVIPIVSTFAGVDTLTVAGQVYQADTFETRSIATQVLIPDANTLVMGGLVTDDPTSANTKVPILGDIPILGYAFRSESKSLNKDNILIFITPTIVQDSDFRSTATTFLKSRPVTMPPPLNPNKAWDGAKPYDWSNPKNTDPTQAILDQKAAE